VAANSERALFHNNRACAKFPDRNEMSPRRHTVCSTLIDLHPSEGVEYSIEYGLCGGVVATMNEYVADETERLVYGRKILNFHRIRKA
jgi:hypothetical protein